MLDPNLLRTEPDAVAENWHAGALSWMWINFARLKSVVSSAGANGKPAGERNSRSKSIGQAKARGEDIEPLRLEVNKLGEQLDAAKSELERCWRKFAISRWRSRIFLMMMCRLAATKTTTLKLAAGVRRVSSILRCAIM